MLTKQYVNSRDVTKVTFVVDFVNGAKLVEVAGDFNDWTPQPLKKLKSGTHKLAVELAPGQDYQYRYLVDGVWENDWAADSYVPNSLGDDNCVIQC